MTIHTSRELVMTFFCILSSLGRTTWAAVVAQRPEGRGYTACAGIVLQLTRSAFKMGAVMLSRLYLQRPVQFNLWPLEANEAAQGGHLVTCQET